MHIRIAIEADIPEMHRIRMSVRENRLLHDGAVKPEDYSRMLNADGRGWVAELDGQIAGFAVGDRRRSNIWALFVDPTFEKRGVGRALHEQMIRWLFAAGADRLWLSTEPGTRAEFFYKAAGWRPAGMQRGEARYELSREEWLARS